MLPALRLVRAGPRSPHLPAETEEPHLASSALLTKGLQNVCAMFGGRPAQRKRHEGSRARPRGSESCGGAKSTASGNSRSRKASEEMCETRLTLLVAPICSCHASRAALVLRTQQKELGQKTSHHDDYQCEVCAALFLARLAEEHVLGPRICVRQPQWQLRSRCMYSNETEASPMCLLSRSHSVPPDHLYIDAMRASSTRQTYIYAEGKLDLLHVTTKGLAHRNRSGVEDRGGEG